MTEKKKKIKTKCCQKYVKKGKHCKGCPLINECSLPYEEEGAEQGKKAKKGKKEKKTKKKKKKKKKKKADNE